MTNRRSEFEDALEENTQETRTAAVEPGDATQIVFDVPGIGEKIAPASHALTQPAVKPQAEETMIIGDEYEPPPRQSSVPKGVIIGLVALLVLGGAAIGFMIWGGGSKEEADAEPDSEYQADVARSAIDDRAEEPEAKAEEPEAKAEEPEAEAEEPEAKAEEAEAKEPEPAAEEPEPTPKKPEPVSTIGESQLIGVFDIGAVRVNKPSRGMVKKALKWMKRCTGTLVLTGHTCTIGNESVNEALGLKRAQAMARFLRRKGFPKNKIEVASAGASDPTDSNDTPKGRAHNRRVVATCSE